jgi:recombination associated protein RdgC
MPLQKGSASFSRFRVEHDGKQSKSLKKDLPAAIGKSLAAHAFEPLDRKSEDERASGFVELADKNGTRFSASDTFTGPFAVFALRIDEVRIPAAAIRAELETWEQAFVKENERKPGKKEKADAKQEIRHTLKSRYPLSSKLHEVNWNLDTGHAQLWAGSRKAIDEVQDAVENAFSVKLVPIAPVTIAPEMGIADKALTPTPALSMLEEHQ